jgi:hypothetical protein
MTPPKGSFRSKSLRSKSFRSKSFRSKSFRSKSFRSKSFRSKSFRSKSFRRKSVAYPASIPPPLRAPCGGGWEAAVSGERAIGVKLARLCSFALCPRAPTAERKRSRKRQRSRKQKRSRLRGAAPLLTAPAVPAPVVRLAPFSPLIDAGFNRARLIGAGDGIASLGGPAAGAGAAFPRPFAGIAGEMASAGGALLSGAHGHGDGA